MKKERNRNSTIWWHIFQILETKSELKVEGNDPCQERPYIYQQIQYWEKRGTINIAHQVVSPVICYDTRDYFSEFIHHYITIFIQVCQSFCSVLQEKGANKYKGSGESAFRRKNRMLNGRLHEPRDYRDLIIYMLDTKLSEYFSVYPMTPSQKQCDVP